MDGKRFDKLARTFAGDTNRRGFLKRIAGIAAGAAAVTLPSRVAADAVADYCDYGYGCAECKYGDYPTHKACNGAGYEPYCAPKDECCGEPGKNYVCEYGEWTCPTDGYKLCGDDCVPAYSCCPYDEGTCPKGETCEYGYSEGKCVCDGHYCEDYTDYPGICVSYDEFGCCSDKDCKSYGDYENQWTCEYGTCTAPIVEVPEVPETEKPVTPPNYSKPLDRTCNVKCVKNGRKAARRKKVRITGSKLKRMRNSCKRRCAKNSR